MAGGTIFLVVTGIILLIISKWFNQLFITHGCIFDKLIECIEKYFVEDRIIFLLRILLILIALGFIISAILVNLKWGYL